VLSPEPSRTQGFCRRGRRPRFSDIGADCWRRILERGRSIASENLDEESRRARRAGELEAEAADLKLRLGENLARERRIVDRLLGTEAALAEMKRGDLELRARLDRYSQFHRDLERSLVWRAIQFLRRLVGRSW
jgi:hypothetical protein